MTKAEILAVAKPILFNEEMVRAILEGRKTQTRRLIKPPAEVTTASCDGFMDIYVRKRGKDGKLKDYAPIKRDNLLYVRETWCRYSRLDERENAIEGTEEYYFKAGHEPPFNLYIDKGEYRSEPIWRPSIHMPKEAARIFLLITKVRVQKLQDISENDATAEGFVNDIDLNFDTGASAKAHFRDLWNSTVSKNDLDKYGWDADPWVWVYEFERVMPE